MSFLCNCIGRNELKFNENDIKAAIFCLFWNGTEVSYGELNFFLQERNNKPFAPESTHEGEDEVTREGHREDKNSSLSEPHSSEIGGRGSEEVGRSEEAESEGSIQMKRRMMVNKPLSHIPSLSLDSLASEDGVLRRPYENCVIDGRDPSPDRNDSDSLSAYEDASAETPEQDQVFPGEADTLELPHDSENKGENPTNNCQVNDSKTQDPKNPDSCVVS